MNIQIINIGDELLIGQVINSNAAFMSQQLLQKGFFVEKTIVIGDNAKDIRQAIEESFQSVDIVILTGGLGPTKDDITKKVIVDYFQTELVIDTPTLNFISQLLKSRNVPMSDINRQQAAVPKNGVVIPNILGTAPGIWIEQQQKVLIALPGVPFEMEQLMTAEIIPRLEQKFHSTEHYLCKVIQLTGIGESTLSDLLESWELQLPSHISLAYLPQPGLIRLRLTGCSQNATRLELEMNNETAKLSRIAAPYIVAFNDDPLEKIIGQLLLKNHQTLSTAESCTGGYIAHRITSISGSSQYFKGSIVSYANEIKQHVLNVSETALTQMGAVSEEVVRQMADNVRKMFQTDFSIAVSGIAGPDGGTNEKPVGTVWIAIATPKKTISFKCNFGNAGGRMRIIQRAAIATFASLLKEIQNNRH
ncbi:MAG: competence/damage-inducible protein A [Bacteroidales bacterium]|nr:competence/damage-inducible protein A [Bacteroidales bacterium]